MTPRAPLILTLLCALPPPGTQAQDASRRASVDSVIVGTVVDAESLAPVPGAVVTARTGEWSRRTITDENGAYRLPIGPDRPLHITVERYGYTPLSMDAEQLEPTVRLDFALTPEPVLLAPLTVPGRMPPRLAALVGRAPVVPEGAAKVMETSLERDRMAPFTPVLQVVDAGEGDPGDVPGPRPDGGDGTAQLAVRGHLSRLGATFVDGAPAALADPASFLADPFRTGLPRRRLRVWDAGAPARITGGLEYVAELDRLPRTPGPGRTWSGTIDMVRASADLDWRGRRLEAGGSGYATTPWTERMVGEDGHRSWRASVGVRAAPGSTHRLAATGSVRHEALPAGAAARAGDAILDDRTGSLTWEAAVAGGLLEARLGVARARTSLPSAVSPAGQEPAFTLREDRSYLAVEYRRLVGRSVALALGGDRLGFRWRGSTAAEAAVWGAYGEVAWTPVPRLGLRAGTRLDLGPGDVALEPAPRLHLDWLVRDGLELGLGSGVHHQVLLEPSTSGVAGERRPVLVSGTHHRARATLRVGALELGLDGYLKSLAGRRGVDGGLGVWGVGFGLDAPTGSAGGLALATTIERRREDGRMSWAPLLRVRLDEWVATDTRVRLSAGASRSTGGLLFGGTTADSLRVADGATLADPGSDLGAWSMQFDAELSRVVHRSPTGRSVHLYVQVLNALGEEFRPLFVQNTGVRDPYLPRVLVVGLGISSATPGGVTTGSSAR